MPVFGHIHSRAWMALCLAGALVGCDDGETPEALPDMGQSSGPVCAFDDSENADTALPLTLGTPSRGSICPIEDQDWHAFVVPAGHALAKVELSILVPRHVALSLGQVSASALVSGLAARATLSTVSGPLQVESHRGDLDLNTVSGDVEVSGGAGRLAVNGVSASVTATGALQEVGVDTVSGEVLLDVHGAPRSITVNTVSADVTLRLDADQGVRATTRTVSGRGRIVGRAVPKRGGTEVVEGTNAFRFAANTVSGAVTVVRRDA